MAQTKKAPVRKSRVAKPVVAIAAPTDVNYMITRATVFNIINNARYVVEACKCKMIMPAHLKAISMIQATIGKNKIGSLPPAVKKMSGGDPVMASEYYGVDSGRYYDISQVQQLEAHMFSDSALSRAEMPIKMGGGRSTSDELVSAAMVKKCIKEMREAPKVHKDAVEMMRMSAEMHVNDLHRELGSNPSLEKVRAFITRKPHYAHLRHLV